MRTQPDYNHQENCDQFCIIDRYGNHDHTNKNRTPDNWESGPILLWTTLGNIWLDVQS